MRKRLKFRPTMPAPKTRNGRRFSALFRNNSGVAALEFAIIVPIVLSMLTGIIQFGFVLFIENHMADVARDTARRFAVGESDQSEAVQYAQDTLLNWGVTYTVRVTPNADDVDVVVSLPMASAGIIDMLGLFQSGTLSVSVTMLTE